MPNKAFVKRSADPMDSKEKSLLCVQLARSRRAQDVVVLDLREMVSFADFFLLCTGRSDRQVQAIAEHLARELKPLKMRPQSVEGLSTGRWVLMDFEDVIVHVFQASVREFYDLEGLWSDAPRLELPPDLEEETRSAVPGEEPDE